MTSSIVNMTVGLVVTAVAARYFGPESFGRFSYALSLVVLFTAFANLGLETLTVRSFLSGEYSQAEVLGTSLALRLLGGVLLTALSLTTVVLLEPGDRGLRVMVALFSLMMVFKSIDVIDYWFQSRQLARTASLIKISSYILVAALKVFVVFMHGNIYEYSALYVVDALMVGIGFFFAYRRLNGAAFLWKFHPAYAKHVLSRSWYLIVSGFMGTLYMRVDQVMLGSMSPDKGTVGIYAAAVTIAAMWFFVPAAVITSVNPSIMRSRVLDAVSYETRVQDLYVVIAWISLAFCLVVAVGADVIVAVVYGSAYAEAADVLRVGVFAGVFALLGSVRGTWLVCEELQRFSVVFNGGGAAINILLNLLLIPLYGAYGAAMATLAAQALAVMVLPLVFSDTRIATRMMLRGFSPRRALRLGLRVVRG